MERDYMKQIYHTMHGADECFHWNCFDCGISTCTFHGIAEYYVVQDYVWHVACRGSGSGMLCIGCLEKRLERELSPNDFKNIKVNHLCEPIKRSLRLSERLFKRV